MQHDIHRPIPQRQPIRLALDDPDVRLVGVAGTNARRLEQLRLRFDAVGAPGMPRQEHGVVPDAGSHVGDALAGERSDPLQRREDLAVRVDHVPEAGVQGRVRIRPGREDGAHGEPASYGIETRVSAGAPASVVSSAAPARNCRSNATGPLARRVAMSEMVSVAPESSGPQPSEIVPAGSPCSPGPMTHLVQGCMSASVNREGEGWNGDR